MRKRTEASTTVAEPATGEEWVYLESRPQSWRRQLFVKGRRLRASTIWSDMLTNGLTPEQVAWNKELPVEAVLECIRYCETHQEVIRTEANEEKRRLLEAGVALEPPPSAG
jgi:uncharacterized protein (DUF433 family)